MQFGYYVKFDDNTDTTYMLGTCLADIAAQVRGKAKRIRVWSQAMLQLIDTKFGDVYNLCGSQPDCGVQL